MLNSNVKLIYKFILDLGSVGGPLHDKKNKPFFHTVQCSSTSFIPLPILRESNYGREEQHYAKIANTLFSIRLCSPAVPKSTS